uniref:Uncharacterized protein n=1 Tax=Anopheles quadriannulatus TaxID=34691 RepID=A0A182XQ65_ANOQN
MDRTAMWRVLASDGRRRWSLKCGELGNPFSTTVCSLQCAVLAKGLHANLGENGRKADITVSGTQGKEPSFRG